MTVSFFAVNIINSIAMLYASAKIMNSKINFKNYKIYVVLILLTLYSFFMYQVTQNFYRVIILLQLYIIGNFIIHRKNEKSLAVVTMASLTSWLMLVISEIICGLIIYTILGIVGITETANVFANTMISLFVILVFFLIISIKKILILLQKSEEKVNNFRSRSLLMIAIFISLLFSMMLYLVYFDLHKDLKMFILLIILLGYTFVLYTLFIETKKTKDIQGKLETMINVTTGYEQALEENRISNHENKNQLIVLGDMIDSKNKKARDYLKKLLETNLEDDDSLLIKVSTIPMGGLRGLIYYKLLSMKDKEIESSVSVSKSIKKNILDKVDIGLLQSFCKIVGVFLDNAIEAVENEESKIINIEIYIDDNFFIVSVCNKYKGKIDFENLGKTNMTTKGANHGYGLKLVESLLKENYKLINQKKIVGDLFIQIIKMNIY